jgi:hypothetical protein
MPHRIRTLSLDLFHGRRGFPGQTSPDKGRQVKSISLRFNIGQMDGKLEFRELEAEWERTILKA